MDKEQQPCSRPYMTGNPPSGCWRTQAVLGGVYVTGSGTKAAGKAWLIAILSWATGGPSRGVAVSCTDAKVAGISWGATGAVAAAETVVGMTAGAAGTTAAGLILLGGASPPEVLSTCSMGRLSLTLGLTWAATEGTPEDFLKHKLWGRGFHKPVEEPT